MKELKDRQVKLDDVIVIFALVESGEGIESFLSRSVFVFVIIWWNPVKELKGA